MSSHSSCNSSNSNSLFQDTEILDAYDTTSYGHEFLMPQTAVARTKEAEERRSRAQMDAWKEKSSFAQSQRIPKSSLAKACHYETRRVFSESIVTWSVFFVLASIAGVIGGLALTHLSL